MEYLFIYLLQICNAMVCVYSISIIIFIIALVFLLLTGILTNFQFEKYEPECWGDMGFKQASIVSRKLVKISLIVILITLFFPTKQTLLLVGGTYLGKKVINSEKMQKVDEIINLQLDKYIKELKEVK